MNIRCPSCGFENAPGIKFCGECGSRLAAAPAAPVEPRTYTPRHLAEKILTSRAALVGERKQVTVLFADVKGSMELAEQVDAEGWHKIMNRFFTILAEGVHRFEGTVNQYTGDGIMALFGAPIAHEDHAQRACFAALHLQDALRRYADELRLGRGLNFSVRMGLNSGEVVVGRIGDDLRMDYTAQGHTVGLAQRMEQIAEPGRAYVTAHTAALVEGYFRLRDLGPMSVKGASTPLRVYELTEAGTLQTRFEASRARGFSRFVGRTAEMAALEAALARALAGDGQVVGVVGEAGVGKSRLCHEFLERCRARGITSYGAHGMPHGKAIPLLPILQLMRTFFGITEMDEAAAAREKIAGKLLLLDRTFDDSLPLLFDFLGVADPERPAPPVDASARQQQISEMFQRVVHVRGRREPAVAFFEDLHWFDAASEAFLGPIVEARAGARSLLLLNFRPEYHAAWMHCAHYRQIALRPLGPEETTELVRSLLGTDPSLTELATAVGERTGGNPFFIEELVRSLEETGAFIGTRGAYRLARPLATLAVPATVQAVLGARIDRLGEREKETLQTAAVIGRDFREGLLAQVLGRAQADLAGTLGALVAAEFLYESALYPERKYTFAHALTQEVAYGTQLGDRRAHVHAAVANALEGGEPEKLDERAAILAHHWQAANEPLFAARWHRRAADWALRTNIVEARRHWGEVRALLGRLPASAEQAELGAAACAQLLSLAMRLGMSETEAASTFAEGKTWAAATNDPRQRIAVLFGYNRFRVNCLGDIHGYLEGAEEILRLAAASGDRDAEIGTRMLVCFAYAVLGRSRDMVAESERLFHLAAGETRTGAALLGYSPIAFAQGLRGYQRGQLGDMDGGEQDLEQGLAIAARDPSPEVLGFCHWFAAMASWARGDAAGCMRHALDTMEIARKLGHALLELIGHTALGEAHLLGEAWGDAIAVLEQSVAIMRNRHAALLWEGILLDRLAQAHLGAGNFARARALVDDAIAFVDRRSTVGLGYHGHLTLARVVLATAGTGEGAAIEAALAAAQRLVERTGSRAEQPHIHLARAELAGALGDAETRRRELREAQRLFAEIGATGWAARVAKGLVASS